MRHGRVSQSGKAWITARELRSHIEGYNSAPIMPPAADLTALCDAPFIVCSTLRRSKDSAVLRFGRHDRSDALFNEAGLPDIRLPLLPLPAAFLMVLSRISWVLACGQGCETYAVFKDRAQDAARALINISVDHKCVVLVGHGMMNRHIARYLLANGYTGSARPSSTHWDCTTYAPVTPRNNSRN